MQAKAGECALETMNRDDIMMLELIRGVSDSKLQQRLLMEPEPTLSGLVQIAEQWKVQTAVDGWRWTEDGGNTVSRAPSLDRVQTAEDGGNAVSPAPPLDEGAALYHAHTIDTLEDEIEARLARLGAMEQPALQQGYIREWICDGIQKECGIVVNFNFVDGKALVTIGGRELQVAPSDGSGREGFVPRCLNLCQQTHQQTEPTCAALPDSARNDAGEVAFFHNIRRTSSGGDDHQRDDRVAYLSREREVSLSGRPENSGQKMPVVAISPHSRYGGEPFEREVEFEPDIERAMVLEDLVGLFGSMEMVSPSPVASVNGQKMKFTGLVDFSVVYVDRSCNVAAWVTPDLQDSMVTIDVRPGARGHEGQRGCPVGATRGGRGERRSEPRRGRGYDQ